MTESYLQLIIELRFLDLATHCALLFSQPAMHSSTVAENSIFFARLVWRSLPVSLPPPKK